MNMKTIDFVEQSVYQIKNLLLGDVTLRKLLYLQTPSALTSNTEVTASQVTDLISIIPYVQDDDGVENSSQSNFVVIYPSYMDFTSEVEHKINISIDVFVYKDYYLLDGAKIRLTQILNRVVYLLEDKKLAFAEKFTISDARLTSIDQGKTLGYLTTWSVVNGTELQY
jgi:hypothetical protein